MSNTTYKPEQQKEREYFNFTTTTLAETLFDQTSSIPQWQRNNLLRDVLKSMGEATVSGQSITREVIFAKVLEMAWKSRTTTNPLPGDQLLEWNLQHVTILMDCDNLGSVTFPPHGLEDLVSPKKAYLPSKKRGELFSKVALLYLRERSPHCLQMAKEYLHLALDAYLMTKPYDKESILPIAQDLADVLELQGDIGLESEHFGKETRIPRWLAEGVKTGRMSAARHWCEANNFDKDQFYEAKKTQEMSPLAKCTKEEYREAFTPMLRFTARTVAPYRMSIIASELLLLASDTCNSDFAKDLLDCGAKVNTLDEHGRSSLHRLLLCRKYGDSGGFRLMKLLLDDDPSILDIQDENGKTALTLACEAEYIHKIDELLKYGANPNIQDSHRCSPFFIACSKGSDEIIKLFLEDDKTSPRQGNLQINAPGPGRQTPLIAVVRFAGRGDSKDSGLLDAIKLLKQHGADPDHKDSEDLSAFDYANGFNKAQIRRILKHTTSRSGLSLTSLLSNSRPNPRSKYPSSFHSGSGHPAGSEPLSERQSGPTRPVEHDGESEAIQPQTLTEQITR
ncbi:hypothetical protein KJ359_001654 [Pestalotiopsis sp. 9143b]|nr:hypothetical protein KJ359_001654 [Pestalotiopsis sp. 9143b]